MIQVSVTDFTRSEKSPRILEEELNLILAKGAFKSAQINESQSGRLYVSIYYQKDAPAKTKCKVFRDVSSQMLQDLENKFLSDEDVDLKMPMQVVASKSNVVFKILFYNEK